MEISRMGSSSRLGILVDTNVLMSVYDRIDPFELVISSLDFKPVFYIPSLVLKELQKFLNENPAKEKRARVALKYLEVNKNLWEVIEVEDNGLVDDVLLRLCKERGYLLYTNDYRLKERALSRGIKVIYLRQKSKNISLDIII
ncbi:MAG: PIN domain-containing protein [Sulfolobus sp.]